jgi:hypothetical protein
MDHRSHYRMLFTAVQSEYGPFDPETMTSIVGFSAGGPVSLMTINKASVCATCELSLYPEQQRSSEGMRFELLSRGSFSTDTCRSLFTALGALSMDATFGAGHTVDVSGVIGPSGPSAVQLLLYSRATIGKEEFGVYEVLPA